MMHTRHTNTRAREQHARQKASIPEEERITYSWKASLPATGCVASSAAYFNHRARSDGQYESHQVAGRLSSTNHDNTRCRFTTEGFGANIPRIRGSLEKVSVTHSLSLSIGMDSLFCRFGWHENANIFKASVRALSGPRLGEISTKPQEKITTTQPAILSIHDMLR
jgi:hypothetical protein